MLWLSACLQKNAYFFSQICNIWFLISYFYIELFITCAIESDEEFLPRYLPCLGVIDK